MNKIIVKRGITESDIDYMPHCLCYSQFRLSLKRILFKKKIPYLEFLFGKLKISHYIPYLFKNPGKTKYEFPIWTF
jgi:hypothetical protein